MAEQVDFSQLSPFELPTAEIEAILRSGDDPRLRSYFGDETYEELRELVRQPPTAVRRGGPLVLILPGILGSTIGLKHFPFNDTIWFDPVSLIRGDATKMALTARQRCETLDTIPLLYMLLRLRLRLHGFKVRDHYYDWRKSLDELGQELADRIDGESASEVYLVAHSMGGLVARAALATDVDKVKRLVMLGTPNRGSFAAVQVLRAVNGTVQLVAKLDLENDPDQLVNRVFNTFPSVYQMLPLPEVYDRVDLYDANNWPSAGPKIRKPILSATRSVQEGFAPGDERFHLIAGIGQETVTDMTVAPDGRFAYHTTSNGDETVPVTMAELPGIEDRTRYVRETHNGLVKNRQVAEAVCQILDSGRTDLLGASRSTRRGETAARTIGEADFLAADPYAGRRGQGLTEREQASALEHAFSTLPPRQSRPSIATGERTSPRGSASVAPGDPEYCPLTGVVVSRRTQHRLDVELAQGNLFDVPARAYVMGIYQNVAPSGPATFVDTATEGALSEFVARNLISGGMGQVFMMPTGCHPLRSDVILIAGLGEFDRFQGSYESVLRLVSENTVRTLINSGIDELATVMLGGGSGTDIPRLLDAMFAGFANGLSSSRGEMRFRRVVLSESDPERYQQIKRHLYWKAASPDFANVELTLDEINYKPPVVSEVRRDSLLPTEEEQSTVLFTRLTAETDSSPAVMRATVLTAGGKAAVVPSALEIDESELDKLLDRLDDIRKIDMEEFGTELAQFLFTPEFLELLGREEIGRSHLRIINDLQASRIPWETLRLGGESPALKAGVSRLLEARPDSIAKWVEARRVGQNLDILLIVNPTGDLPGAASEGDAIARAIRELPEARLTELREKEATKARVLEHFQSGEFDVVHYAGHAFFDPDDRSGSGILCHDKVLAGRDLAMLDRLPTLVFLNACEAGRVRGAKAPATRARIEKSTGIAEALLRAGIAQFVGTYWPVGDAAAEHFAKSFYKDVINAEPMGTAVVNARNHVSKETKSVDWADYIHYGDSRFRLKQPQ